MAKLAVGSDATGMKLTLITATRSELGTFADEISDWRTDRYIEAGFYDKNTLAALREAGVKIESNRPDDYEIVAVDEDGAACQFIEVFDYRKGNKPFGGKLDRQTSPEDVLAALIPPTVLPEEILPIIAQGSVSGEHGFSQLAMTASLFGALIAPIVLRLLANESLSSHIRVDLFGVTMPRPARVARRTRTLARLPFVWMAARKKASAA